MNKEILYYDDEVALYYDKDIKVYTEYRRNTSDNGIGTSSQEPPQWYVRMMKIESVLLENIPH